MTARQAGVDLYVKNYKIKKKKLKWKLISVFYEKEMVILSCRTKQILLNIANKKVTASF